MQMRGKEGSVKGERRESSASRVGVGKRGRETYEI